MDYQTKSSQTKELHSLQNFGNPLYNNLVQITSYPRLLLQAVALLKASACVYADAVDPLHPREGGWPTHTPEHDSRPRLFLD